MTKWWKNWWKKF